MAPNKFTWPLINDNITESDKEAMINFIKTPNVRFTNGPRVREFEDKWSQWLGVDHTTFVNSGASANYVMMSIVKELKGAGEVIVPPIGWVSDVAPAVNLGMTPVFVDVDKKNFSMTFENIKAAVTPYTKAIVLVHAMGFNAMTEELRELADQYNIFLIEDCCESHGATYDGQKIGTFGDMSNFSFYFGHHITTIEGGVVCTNNPELHEYARLFRSHGMTREASPALQEHYKKKYPDLNPLFTFAVPGYNLRSMEMNAVLGMEQLQRLDSNIQRRVENMECWVSHLDSNRFFTDYALEGNSNFALPLILQEGDKELLCRVAGVLEEVGVEYRIGTAGGGNQARQPYLREGLYEYKIVGRLDTADYIHDFSLYVGNHTDLTKEQIIDLCERINNV
tara:strand:- start:2277 stop:3458 length:1182 start_codon:yes stop_codon:yes gene_type:complete